MTENEIDCLKKRITELNELTEMLMERISAMELKCMRIRLELSTPENTCVMEDGVQVYDSNGDVLRDENIEWEGYKPQYLELPSIGHFEIYVAYGRSSRCEPSEAIRCYIKKVNQNDLGNVTIVSKQSRINGVVNVRWLKNKRPAVYYSDGVAKEIDVEIMYRSL